MPLLEPFKSPKSAFAKVHANSFSAAATEVIWSLVDIFIRAMNGSLKAAGVAIFALIGLESSSLFGDWVVQ